MRAGDTREEQREHVRSPGGARRCLLAVVLLSAAGCATVPRHRITFRPPPLPVDEQAVLEAPARYARALALMQRPMTREQRSEAWKCLSSACSGGLHEACTLQGEQFVPPVPLERSDFKHTEEAKQRKASGRLEAQCTITAEGTVRDCLMLEEMPYGMSEAFLEAARRGRYAPALLFGQPFDMVYVFSAAAEAPDSTGEERLAEAEARLAAYPESTSALKHLALTRRAFACDRDECLPLLERALEQRPGDPDLLHALALQHFRKGRLTSALAPAEQAARALPPDLSALLTYADLLYRVGQRHKSCELVERLQQDPPAARGLVPVEVLRKRLEAYSGRCRRAADEDGPTGFARRP